MGWHFKHLSGLDTLNVDQKSMSEADAPARENALYRQAADNLRDAAVFLRGKNCFVQRSMASGYDMQVFHPRSYSAQGRPDWLKNGTGRVVVRVPEAAQQAASKVGTALFRAYLPRELTAQAWRAIPADQIIVEKDRPACALMLLPGQYRLQAWTAEGKIIYDALLKASVVPHNVRNANAEMRTNLRCMIKEAYTLKQTENKALR